MDVYEAYRPQAEYFADGVERSFGAFAVIGGWVEEQPAICFGQRDSKGPEVYRRLWELPGGKVPKDRNPRGALHRRLKQEIGIARSIVGPAIGPPLYRVERGSDGRLISVDAARGYLVKITRGRPKANLNGHAMRVCFANVDSLADGFKVLGYDRTKELLLRMGVLIHDGLSVIEQPFFVGPLTDELREMTVENLEKGDFVSLAGGAYLALPFFVASAKDLVPGAGLGWNLRIFRRRNPFQPGGYFPGPLDHHLAE